MDNPPIYCSGHTPINNCWSTLRNHVMHLHLLIYGVPVHMKCSMSFSCQFMLIYQACIYLHNLHQPTCYSTLAITQTTHMGKSRVWQFILELPKQSSPDCLKTVLETLALSPRSLELKCTAIPAPKTSTNLDGC